MTTIISNEQFQMKSYISQYEMMQDIVVIVYVLPATYTVRYKKAL